MLKANFSPFSGEQPEGSLSGCFTPDTLDRLTAKHDGNYTQNFTYAYDRQGRLARMVDNVDKSTAYYSYDLAGRLVDVYRAAGTNAFSGAMKNRIQYTYDEYNRLKSTKYSFADIAAQTFAPIYGNAKIGQDAGRVYGVNRNGYQLLDYAYDGLGRMTSRTVTTDFDESIKTNYTYLSSENKTATTLLSSVSTQLDYEIIGYNYTYDDLGRITQITDVDANIQNTYSYDGLGRMTRENNRAANETYVYTYDNYGNILTKKTYAYTTGTLGTVKSTVNYGYSSTTWRDQLTSYSGSAITYDGIGNPLTWRNGMRFVWMAGRQLSAATNSSGVTYGYAYNNDGIRYEKTVGGTTVVNYYLDGSTVLAESRSNGTKIIYRHDENGNYVGFTLNGVDYYYIYNAQGDVVALVDTYGAVAAKYCYDAWGKVIKVTNASGVTVTSSTHVVNINPIRYRGYYYDVETGLYYLQSRYYDPTVGRFINADDIIPVISEHMQDYNIYNYCEGDPVNKYDPDGHDVVYINDGNSYNMIKEHVGIVATGGTSPYEKYISRALIALGIPHGHWFDRTGDAKGRIAMLAMEYNNAKYGVYTIYLRDSVRKKGGLERVAAKLYNGFVNAVKKFFSINSAPFRHSYEITPPTNYPGDGSVIGDPSEYFNQYVPGAVINNTIIIFKVK